MTLPKWAERLEPVDIEGAARILGVSRRGMSEILKKHPFYEKRGNRKVLYPEHIEQIRESMAWQGSHRKSVTAGGTRSVRLVDVASAKALALATAGKRRKPSLN
ncbi:hypothetical protein ASG43_03095 [Aureimonas sp. Leaf454]|nr:hypothetical protein ASG43_03095 [Aureimonas sp. Leaf454]